MVSEEEAMRTPSRAITLIVLVFGVGVLTPRLIETAAATAQGQQTVASEKTHKLAAGDAEVKRLLLLMDRDKDGKISKQEFMNFMEEEFDRLDKDKSGKLDANELTKFQLQTRQPFTAVGK